MSRRSKIKPYTSIRPCCADHLKEWDCYCTFGCDVCWGRWQCSVCGKIYGNGGPNSVKGTLSEWGILDQEVEVFKVQRSIVTTADVAQLMVYNKVQTVMYQAGADTPHGKKLWELFRVGRRKKVPPDLLKVFVKGAFSKKKGFIFMFEPSKNWSW